MKPLVLICSDDAEFYLVYNYVLEVGGFRSKLVDGVEAAVRQASEQVFRAVIIDCQPASEIAAAICVRLKGELQNDALPVVALIAPTANHQHLDLLKAGIDKSFIRPFPPAMLLSYLRAELAMERPDSEGVENGRSVTWGDLEMHLTSHRVHCCNGQQIRLSQIEFNLLRHLIENRGNVCSRDELIGAAWPENIHVDGRTVDVHISRLRKTLSEILSHNVIRTIRSIGYAIEECGM
ncbi:two-component system, OmpR family, phosphate regulon response regulator PhoB (plasmid) [Ensifer sp. WSM1721]|uniref:winged helix-turn-helix transcriptional regulator n=1 Tax=Ensifer sp. WSM1721 TaxID=1041159 RepID=UPI000556FA79|nr:response regulator transcription factor [Ensifer sp. WSM1721]